MIRLALLVAAICAAWRLMKRVIDENRNGPLLPALSLGNRPPEGSVTRKTISLASRSETLK